MALRGGLLSTGGSRESHQGTALRYGDWPHQLHQFLGQSVPRSDDRCGLRTDAGAALAPGPHGLCSGTSLNVTRALLETRRSGGRLGTPYRAASAASFPVLRSLLSPCFELGRANWLSSPAALPRKFLLATPQLEVSLWRQNLIANLANSLRISLSFHTNSSLVAYPFAVTKNSSRGQLSRMMRAKSFPGLTFFAVSAANYLDWQRQSTSFEAMAIYGGRSLTFGDKEQ